MMQVWCVLIQKIAVRLLQEPIRGILHLAGIKPRDCKSNGLKFLDSWNKIVIIFSISEMVMVLELHSADKGEKNNTYPSPLT